MSRSNRRRDKSSAVHEIPLRDCNDFHVRMITLREARQLAEEGTVVLDKEWRHGKHAAPEITGARLSGPRNMEQRPVVPITRGEADAIAGRHMLNGGSHTIHLTEEQKQLRVERIAARLEKETGIGKRVALDDFQERALGKIAFYPAATYDPKNPATVGPRVDKAALNQFVNV